MHLLTVMPVLPNGNAVAHTAMVADAPKIAFIRFVISIHLSRVSS